MRRIHLTVGAGALTLAVIVFAPLDEPAPLPTTAGEAEAYVAEHVSGDGHTVHCALAADEMAAFFECELTAEVGEDWVVFVLRAGAAP
jgi:flagellar biosynthesis/type III secretory pathway ATPase